MALNAGSFKPGHKAHPNRYQNGSVDYRNPAQRTEYERLKSKFIRELKREFGSDLTTSQKEHLDLAGGYKARLQLHGEKLDHVTAVLLGNALRRELAILSGD